jgi:hypothetical protein
MFWHQIAATNLLQRISNVGSVSFVLPHTGKHTLLVKNQAAAMIQAMYIRRRNQLYLNYKNG